MKGKLHLFWSVIFFLLIWGIFEFIQITKIIFPIALASFPDIDHHFRVHRSIITHSILIPFIVYIFNPDMIFLLFILTVGFHCLLDIHFLNKNKRRGSYMIKIYKIRLNGWWSTIWLFGNFMGSLILFIIGVVIL